MVFINQPTGGPDVVGGFFPGSHGPVKCINRSTTTLVKGDLVMLAAFDPAAIITAAAITTNDSNSYLPGAGDSSSDSVWNTVTRPTAVGLDTGAIFGVVTSTSVADDGIVDVVFYGLVDAMCISTGTIQPGDPLTGTVTNKNLDAVFLSNERIIAHYMSPQDASISTRELKKVFLHNGIFGGTQNP